jgi:hypothetical protein
MNDVRGQADGSFFGWARCWRRVSPNARSARVGHARETWRPLTYGERSPFDIGRGPAGTGLKTPETGSCHPLQASVGTITPSFLCTTNGTIRASLAIDPSHRLVIHGMVDRLSLTMTEIQRRRRSLARW